jgi:outer membrane translocation and assembly module TamA
VGLAAAYGLEWTHATGEIPFFGSLDLRARVARLTGSLVFDRRDSVIDATRGFFQSTGLEYGSPRLGSQYQFSKLLLQQFGFFGGPAGTVLASAVRWERASGEDQLLLTSARLSAGGANTVRGYPEDVFAAANLIGSSSGAVSGTTSLVVLNQELRFPLHGSLFGGAFLDHASRFLTGEGRILSRSSIGLGLRFRTSVGVLRVDYGYPLGQGKRGTFYFALGQAF